jgi:heat shock protein 4
MNQETNKISFEVENMGTKHEFSVEQVVAFYLVKIRDYYKAADINAHDMVLTVPAYFSNTERQALMDAVHIAGLKCPRIINESTAIAVQYGFFKKNDIAKDTPHRNVAFVDFGHSKTTVSVAQFTKEKVKILCHLSERNMGARDFDYEIMKKISAIFDKKYGDDPMESPRCKLRMMEAIEKCRKIISADKEATINVDYLLNEEDLVHTLKREEFEEIVAPILEQLKSLCEATLQNSGLNAAEIHSVELLGDATRTPAVQEVVKAAFKKEELSRTLNALECCARGASLQAAYLSPSFNVSKYVMEDYNNYPISITYSFEDQPDKKKTMELFARGTNFPITKSLAFKNKLGNMDLLIHYPSDALDIMKGLPSQLAQYKINSGSLKHEDKKSTCEFVIKVGNNLNQIAVLESAELSEKWTEIEKIAIKKSNPFKATEAPKEPEKPKEGEAKEGEAPKEGEEKKDEKPTPAPETVQEYESKEKTKSTFTNIKFDFSSHAIPPNQKDELKVLESSLYAEDRKCLDLVEAKNKLEAYSYECKNNLDSYGSWEHYLEAEAKTTFLAEIAANVEWLYGEGAESTVEEYKTRIEKFEAIGEKVRERYLFYQALPEMTGSFEKIKEHIAKKISEMDWLTEDQIKIVTDKQAVAQEFFEKVAKDLAGKAKHEEVGFTIKQIRDQGNLLVAETGPILNTKKT